MKSIRTSSPDRHARGLLRDLPETDRYDGEASTDEDDVAAKIAQFILPQSRVLDVGCGTGAVSDVVRRLAHSDLVGIEPDGDRAQLARARGLSVFDGVLEADFLQRHGPFDAIIFADVLEHLPDPGDVVLLAKEGLKPKGAIIASVPNVAHWFVRHDLLRGRFEYQDCGIMDATHLRWFTRESICKFFVNLGFQITGFDSTANAGLPEYYHRAPWRWFNVGARRRLVGFLARRYPTVFGCQHVVRASLPG